MSDKKLVYSDINIKVGLDETGMPEEIQWQAAGSGMEKASPCKAILLSLWDGKDKTSLRVDLWTKDMLIDEMKQFFYETLVTMSDTYLKATSDKETATELKKFGEQFGKKAGVLR
jgi:gliding motility-associated protein GldC